MLVDYASGASTPAESLLIDLHLSFCAGCRRSMQVLFAAGGALLDALPMERLAPDSFGATLTMLDRVTREEAMPPPSAPALPAFAAGWPRPLGRYVSEYGLRDWRRLPGGFRVMRVPLADRTGRVYVMKVPGGRGPLKHTHVRDEWTVVLQGGFSDETGTYNAGDFALAGPDVEHKVIAERDEGCVCVLLLRSAPVYTTWVGKLLAPIIRG